MENILKSFGCLLVALGAIIGLLGKLSPGHTERVLTYVGMGLACVGVVTALYSESFQRSK